MGTVRPPAPPQGLPPVPLDSPNAPPRPRPPTPHQDPPPRPRPPAPHQARPPRPPPILPSAFALSTAPTPYLMAASGCGSASAAVVHPGLPACDARLLGSGTSNGVLFLRPSLPFVPVDSRLGGAPPLAHAASVMPQNNAPPSITPASCSIQAPVITPGFVAKNTKPAASPNPNITAPVFPKLPHPLNNVRPFPGHHGDFGMGNTLFTSTPNGSFQSLLLDVSANAFSWGASHQSLAALEVINSSHSAPVSITVGPAYGSCTSEPRSQVVKVQPNSAAVADRRNSVSVEKNVPRLFMKNGNNAKQGHSLNAGVRRQARSSLPIRSKVRRLAKESNDSDADIGTDFEDSDDDVEFLQESPEKQASDPCCDGNSDQDEPEVEYDSETMETEYERDFEPPPELIVDTDTDDEDQYQSPTESHNETSSPEIQQLPDHSSGNVIAGIDDLKFEIYSPPGLGDCGCVSNQPTYNKRKRWPKGSTPPDCRKPRGMGSIEKAMRNAPNRTTEFIFEPVLGLVFDSTAEAFQFYNLYSWEVGFGIHLGSFSANRVNGRKTMQQFVCDKQGFDSRCTKSSKRIGCKAMLRLHRTPDDGWYVSTHVSEHNHELAVSCGEKRELRSHSRIEQCTKDMVMYLRENNVTLSRVHCIMGSLFGSMEDVPFNQKTLRAVCKRIASDQRDEDVTKTLRLFRKWRQEDPGFQFAVDPDENNKIKTLIWVSGRSRSQWNYFGDVVTFDTTYCTNLYNMPFGMFVGVNNHFQSVLFAGVLMRDETAKSFKWVFNEFLTLVGGKHPVTILTDQCKAMANALRSVMPNTKHLWCKWHILKPAPQELGPIYSVNSPFRREFHYIVNEMLTEDEFERAWADLLDRYHLHGHPFMERTYDKRKMWAKPWAKQFFCARMTSTQRSESANSFLKKVVPRNSSMNRFVEQYRKLTFLRTSAEHAAEHNTKQFEWRSKRVYAVEQHAFSIYTKKAFLLFSAEVDKAAQYVVHGSGSEFQVVHNNDKVRKHWARGVFSVQVLDNGERYCCECGLYDHFGMLCCHVIKVMIHNGVCKIPEAHIMKRWTRNARDVVYDDPVDRRRNSVSNQLSQSLLYGDALEVVRRANNDNEVRDIVRRNLKITMQEIDRLMDWRSKQPGYIQGCSSQSFANQKDIAGSDFDEVVANTYGASGSSAYMSDSDIESIQAPDVNRPKGRPRQNRFRSIRETECTMKKKKQSRRTNDNLDMSVPAKNTAPRKSVATKGRTGLAKKKAVN